MRKENSCRSGLVWYDHASPQFMSTSGLTVTCVILSIIYVNIWVGNNQKNLLLPNHFPNYKIQGGIAFVLLLLCLLSACGSDEYIAPTAKIALVNASPNPFDLTATAANNEWSIIDLPPLAHSNYEAVSTGNFFIEIQPNDGAIAPYNLQIESLEGDRYYSLFVMDTTSNLNHFILVDDASSLEGDTAQVRFVHASPDAPDFDLTATTIDSIFYENLTFVPTDTTKRYTSMLKMPVGNYTFQCFIADSSELFFELPFTLESQQKYTFYVRGKVTPDDNEQDFGVNVIVHEFD